MNNITPLLPAPPALPPGQVFVIATPRSRYLLGTQRVTEERCTSLVLGFRDPRQAALVARRVQRRAPQDSSRAMPVAPLAVELPDLLRRLRGTGVGVQLLTPGPGGALRRDEVYPDATRSAVVGSLRRAYHGSPTPAATPPRRSFGPCGARGPCGPFGALRAFGAARLARLLSKVLIDIFCMLCILCIPCMLPA